MVDVAVGNFGLYGTGKGAVEHLLPQDHGEA